MQYCKFFIGTTICFSLLACSSTRVWQDYDLQANFSRLGSYAWQQLAQKKTDNPHIDNSLLNDRVRYAIDTNLALKGYKKMSREQADFLVVYHYAIRERNRDDRSHTRVGVSRGYWGYYGSYIVIDDHRYDADRYELIVDVLDPKNEKILWRGSVNKKLLQSNSPQQATQRVNQVVVDILSKFPPQ